MYNMYFEDIEWQDRFNIGVASLDNAHRKLFSIIRRMIRLSQEPEKNRTICVEGFKYFKSYAMQHLMAEEGYMRSIQYKDYEYHKRVHDVLCTQTLPLLEQELEDSGYSRQALNHLLGILTGWLTGHIMSEDQAITGKMTSRAAILQGRDMSSLDSLQLAVLSAFYSLFGLKCSLLNEHYTGENFGRTVHYEMAYQSDGGDRVVFHLMPEERLVLGTVGRMLDTTFHTMDELALSAIKELAHIVFQHLVGTIGEDKSGHYHQTADRLLSPDQSEQLFKNHHNLLYSALIGTEQGYFVFGAEKGPSSSD